MAYKYCLATNYGKGFITYSDRENFNIISYDGYLWIVEDNQAGNDWILKNNGIIKTKAQAQAHLDEKYSQALEEYNTIYDSLSDEDKVTYINKQPTQITL